MADDPEEDDRQPIAADYYPTLRELVQMPAWRRRAKELFFRNVPAMAGVVGSVVVALVVARHASRDFFDVAAVLIPALYLALLGFGVLSARSRPLPPMIDRPFDEQSPALQQLTKLDRRITIVSTATRALLTVYLFVIGEISSVEAIAGTKQSGDPRIAAASIAFAVFAFAAAALMSAPRTLADSD
jgi:hypothetical protein